MTLRQVNGQTVTSEKVTRNSSRSFAQMTRRVQWANLVNLFRSFEGSLHPSFENRPPLTSDFNAFMGANIGLVPVYLTKSEAQQGGCVVAGYQVTRGSLPSIDVAEGTGGMAVTDIALGDLAITAETTLKQFSDAVVDNNPDYAHGDQISCFVAEQSVNSVSGIPYVKITALEVTLDCTDDETLLADVVDALGFSSVSGKIGASGTVNGAITWVHSRKTAGGTRVSTQRFYVTNSTLAAYQTAAKRTEAVASYGGSVSQPFLTPNVDDIVAAA